jgi:hypothetical protein
VTTRCPSDLRLEAHLLDPEKSGLIQHVGACAACQVRLERMRLEADHFRQFVFPATVDAVVAAAAPRPGLGWFAAFLPAAAACAAAALFLVKPVAPEGFLAAKGEVLSLEVFTESTEGVRQLVNGELLAEGAPLRFRVKTTVPCRVRIVSADCEGHVVVLFPGPGEDSPLVSGTAVLPAGAKLGGDEGPERIFALCSPEPLPMLALAASLTDQAAGDDDRVRRANRLSGLPAGTLQATLLIEHGEEKPGHGETKDEGGQHHR